MRHLTRGTSCPGILVLLGFLVVQVPPIAANDFKIVPGERIGDVSINMSIDEILRLLGQPSMVEKVGSGSSEETKYTWEGRYIRVYQSLSTGTVASIRTYWLFNRANPYSTDKGIRVGATLQQVRSAYGDAGCYIREGQDTRLVWWPELGLFFFIWTSPRLPDEIRDKVGEIGVRMKNSPGYTPPAGNRPCG